MTQTLDRDWMTRKQAAEYLQVTAATVDRYLKSGVLQGSQLVPNGTVRISAVSIEKMLEKSRQKIEV